MRVFLHLLLSANVEDHDFQHVTIHRGQVATSYEALANALGLSAQNVRTAIAHLKSTGELTSNAYSKFQVLTIVSWDLYQCELTGKLTGNQQATNNNQRSKEVNNILLSELSDESTDRPKQKRLLNTKKTRTRLHVGSLIRLKRECRLASRTRKACCRAGRQSSTGATVLTVTRGRRSTMFCPSHNQIAFGSKIYSAAGSSENSTSHCLRK